MDRSCFLSPAIVITYSLPAIEPNNMAKSRSYSMVQVPVAKCITLPVASLLQEYEIPNLVAWHEGLLELE